MKKTLIDMSIFLGLVPFTLIGLLLLAGAGFFAWGVGLLAFSAGERLVKCRKEQRSFQVQPQQPQPHQGLDLVEMDVSMKFRDRAHDLRVVN